MESPSGRILQGSAAGQGWKPSLDSPVSLEPVPSDDAMPDEDSLVAVVPDTSESPALLLPCSSLVVALDELGRSEAALEPAELELLDVAELEVELTLVADDVDVLWVVWAVDDVVVVVAPEDVDALLDVPDDESEVVFVDGAPESVDAQATTKQTPSAATLVNICRPGGAFIP